MMKYTEFVDMLSKAVNCKTLYILGCFGAPMNASNKKRYTNNYDYNKDPVRKEKILNASDDTFGFDCVCLLKGVLWGWCGDKTKEYGGAIYKSNGVPDINADDFYKACTIKSKDFSNVPVGAILHNKGHVGVYVGAGYAIECTPKNSDGVQRTIVKNIKNYNSEGVITRTWDEWGLSPYVDYSSSTDEPKELLHTIYDMLKDAKTKGVF